jgi:uncharacterized membrane protein YeiH
VFVVAAVVSLIPKIPKSAERLLHFPDAMGLGLFSILGTEIALEQGVSPFVAVLFGVMTGTFGGVIGDIACNEVPNLFRPATPLYATCAFVGGWILLVCKMMPLPDSADFLISAAVVVVLRLLALKFNIGLRAVE